MHVKKRKDSSSCDEDDVPLETMRRKTDSDPNSYDTLILPSREPCELCDKISNNRYTSIIHNVRHIIIPLLNQTVIQCDICLHHFTSSSDLIRHKAKKHTLSEILKQTDLVRTSFNNPTDGTYESDLITIIKKENPKFQMENNSKMKMENPKFQMENNSKMKMENSKFQMENNSKMKMENSKFQMENNSKIKMENKISNKPMINIENFILEKPIVKIENLLLKENTVSDYDDCEFIDETGSDCEGPSLKSRLIFEDDIINLDSNKILNDLTTNCSVKVELFPPLFGERSVHYEELVKPGVFRCKKCSKTFPSRYEAIIHESQHLFIKDSQVSLCKTCKRYILGDFNDLKRHYRTTHSIEATQNIEVNRKDFGGKEKQNGFVYEPLSKKIVTMKLCEVCFSFCKNRSTNNYDCIGELNEIGKRYRCQKCGLKFFAIKLIKRETRYRYASIAKRKIKSNKSNNNKAMSNETRLKIISQRFKMMKKKYFVCFILTLP